MGGRLQLGAGERSEHSPWRARVARWNVDAQRSGSRSRVLFFPLFSDSDGVNADEQGNSHVLNPG
jgi:hypothetical protein